MIILFIVSYFYDLTTISELKSIITIITLFFVSISLISLFTLEDNIVKNEVLLDKTYDRTQVRSHLQAFDKSIIVLIVALNKIATIMEEKENRENLLIH